MESSDFKSVIRDSLLKLLFEFIGTTFLTLLFLCNAGVSITRVQPPQLLSSRNEGVTYCYLNDDFKEK
jgi:hypothetical protein